MIQPKKMIVAASLILSCLPGVANADVISSLAKAEARVAAEEAALASQTVGASAIKVFSTRDQVWANLYSQLGAGKTEIETAVADNQLIASMKKPYNRSGKLALAKYEALRKNFEAVVLQGVRQGHLTWDNTLIAWKRFDSTFPKRQYVFIDTPEQAHKLQIVDTLPENFKAVWKAKFDAATLEIADHQIKDVAKSMEKFGIQPLDSRVDASTAKLIQEPTSGSSSVLTAGAGVAQ